MNYIPYDNMSLQWRGDRTGFNLHLPWVSLDVDVLPEEKGWIEEGIDYLRSNPGHPSVQRFLLQLKDYNVAYTSARKKDEIIPVTVDSCEKPFNLQQYKNPHTLAQSFDDNAYQVLKEILPQEWTWPLQETLKTSHIEGSDLYDPLTIVTYLIGQRLTSECVTTELRRELPQALDRLRIKDERRFFEVMRTLIRQTHYITHTFESCVELSLDSFSQARNLITKFIAEEKGHHRLMEDSLAELGCNNPELLEPFATTTLVMDLFKWAAGNSPLAFTLFVGYFEGAGGYEESDPLADVLKASSKPKAARGYAIHHEINKNEQHNTMITDLADYLAPQREGEVICAVRMLELATLFGEIGDRCLINLQGYAVDPTTHCI